MSADPSCSSASSASQQEEHVPVFSYRGAISKEEVLKAVAQQYQQEDPCDQESDSFENLLEEMVDRNKRRRSRKKGGGDWKELPKLARTETPNEPAARNPAILLDNIENDEDIADILPPVDMVPSGRVMETVPKLLKTFRKLQYVIPSICDSPLKWHPHF